MTSAIVPTVANSPVVARDEQHALLVADVDGQRHVHGREDDGVVERDEKKLSHAGASPSIATYE